MTLHWNLAEPVTVTGNASLLEKAVHNLLSNAIRHAPSGASVWVTLSPQFLRVENSGVRIPEEDLPFLFTPFYRVEKSRNKATGGSGLGLYLVHAIATMHGFSCQIQKHGPRGRGHTLVLSAPDKVPCLANQKINLHHMKSKPSSVRMFPFSGKDGFFYVFFFHRALLYVVRKRVRSLLLLLICLGGGDPGPVWLCHTGRPRRRPSSTSARLWAGCSPYSKNTSDPDQWVTNDVESYGSTAYYSGTPLTEELAARIQEQVPRHQRVQRHLYQLHSARRCQRRNPSLCWTPRAVKAGWTACWQDTATSPPRWPPTPAPTPVLTVISPEDTWSWWQAGTSPKQTPTALSSAKTWPRPMVLLWETPSPYACPTTRPPCWDMIPMTPVWR